MYIISQTLYRRQGDVKNMIKYYLITAEKEPSSVNIQTSLQRFLSEADYDELQRAIISKNTGESHDTTLRRTSAMDFYTKKRIR
jgi:hypothetical protein